MDFDISHKYNSGTFLPRIFILESICLYGKLLLEWSPFNGIVYKLKKNIIFSDFNGSGIFNACQQLMAIGGPHHSRISIGYSIWNVRIGRIEIIIIIMKRMYFTQSFIISAVNPFRILAWLLFQCWPVWLLIMVDTLCLNCSSFAGSAVSSLPFLNYISRIIFLFDAFVCLFSFAVALLATIVIWIYNANTDGNLNMTPTEREIFLAIS